MADAVSGPRPFPTQGAAGILFINDDDMTDQFSGTMYYM